MAKTSLPSPEILRQLLRYEPDTGKLYWRERPEEMFPTIHHAVTWNKRFSGKEAISAPNGNGYLQGRLLGRKVLAHRVAWCLSYGEWPDTIDHANKDRSDNRLRNLRSVTRAENNKNLSRRKTNKSGVTGVLWYKRDSVWQARIRIGGKDVHLGYFKCIAEAALARHKAERTHGFHTSHGL